MRLVVIEIFRIPARRYVTRRAILFPRPAPELGAVNIFRTVAPEALTRSSGKFGRYASACDGWAMALHTRRLHMGALDREFGGGVIEGKHCFPLFGGVAALTGQFRLMWVGVTRVAGLGSEMMLTSRAGNKIGQGRELQHFDDRRDRLVTIVAGHGSVPPSQSELGLHVPRDRKRRGLKRRLRVTKIALVSVEPRSELSLVPVGMARRANHFPGDVHGASSLRLMANRASERSMFPIEREGAVLVGHTVKERRLEGVLIVAG